MKNILCSSLLFVCACFEVKSSNTCDEYVSYMCANHCSAASCEELSNLYEDPDDDLINSCSASLDHITLEDEECNMEETECSNPGACE